MSLRKEFIDDAASLVDVCEKNVGLIIVKICRIKEINATYSFDKGDKYLSYVEESLKSILRSDDIVGRMGDKEFGIVLPNLNNSAHAILAASKVTAEFNHVIDIDGSMIMPKLVMGIAVKPLHGKTLEELMHSAMIALQLAEKDNQDYLLHEIANDDMPQSLVVESEIQNALEEDEFTLFCQPKIDLDNKTIYGGESLIRWNSKKFGFVNTQYFIDVLENSSSLMPVTNWVLSNALRQCLHYQVSNPDFKIAVNLSPSLLVNRNIVEVISSATTIWSIDPSSLILEVTEGAMMMNPTRSMKILNELNERGFGISIDDFGTGYSSLAYLKDLPVDEMKIDKSFILNMANDKKNASIVQAAVSLGHNLGLKVVAEGVEDEKTLNLLAEMGCNYAQGYYVAKPMPYEEMIEWMKKSEWQ